MNNLSMALEFVGALADVRKDTIKSCRTVIKRKNKKLADIKQLAVEGLASDDMEEYLNQIVEMIK